MADKPPVRQRTYSKDVSFGFHTFNLTGDLVPVRVPNSNEAAKLSLVCPECPSAEKVGQRYECPNGHLHLPSDLHKATDTGSGLVKVTDEEAKAINDDGIEAGTLMFDAVPAETVASQFRPDTTAYRVRLGAKSDTAPQRQMYAMIRALAARPDFRLVGNLKARSGDPTKPYMAEVWGDQLVIQSLIRPEDLAPCERIETDYDESLASASDKLDELLATLAASKPFDEAQYSNGRKVNALALKAAKAADPSGVVVVPAKAPVEIDLLGSLEATLAALKPVAEKPKRKAKVA